jgi:Rnl2 family RNA ligase
LAPSGEVTIRCARRTEFIEDGVKFYNFRPVLEKYRSSLEELRKESIKYDFILYGELFGGNVAAGMCYPVAQDFVAFDLCAMDTQEPIHKLALRDYCRFHSIPTAPFIGVFPDLASALAVNESFTSKLKRPDFDGAEEHTEAEGLVIEPVQPRYFKNEKRVYFKKKTKRFLEKGGNKIPKPQEKLPEELEGILLESFEYITEPRFESVASKVGEVSIKDIGKITGLMTQDILIDMEKDELEIPDNKQFMKLLQSQVMTFLRPILLAKE